MRKFLLTIAILAAIPALAACGTTIEPEELLTLTAEEFPRMDGSTATIPLGEATAAVLMGISRAEAANFANFSGTAHSFSNLLFNTADLLIVYEPAAQTRQTLQHGNPNIDSLRMAPIGYDALVFIVNAANPVNSLTVEQVRDIYAGRITNWSEVGGEDAEIIPFQRNVTAGSHALMLSLVMGDTPFIDAPQHHLMGGMGMMLSAVADFDNGRHAIGYHVFYYVSEMMNNPDVKILDIEGVAPSQATISSGDYPLRNHFYAVIRGDEPADSPAERIFYWLQSPEGQALIYREGYAPLN
jgi:phosphate transport system substrate-binding protein